MASNRSVFGRIFCCAKNRAIRSNPGGFPLLSLAQAIAAESPQPKGRGLEAESAVRPLHAKWPDAPRRNKSCLRPRYRRLASFAAYIFLAAALHAAPDAAAKPQDFAGQVNLSAEADQLMSLELPEYVYRHAERRDLGDIRVFDADGVPVPCELRRAPRVEETPANAPLAFFPWTAGEKDLPRPANIEIDSGGALIKVNPGAARTAVKEQCFLIDLTGLSHSPASLNLEITKTTRPWNGSVTLQYSGDLANWRSFNRAQTLAGFGGAAGAPADRTTVSLPEGLKGSYVLLTLGETVPPLRGLSAAFHSVSRPSFVRESLFPGTKSEDGFSVTYAPDGFFPGLELDFILSQADSLNIEISCRYSDNEPWRLWDRGALYLINDKEKGARKNPPWYGDADAPLWRIKSTSGLPFASVPDMRLVWEPLRVVFLARGRGGWVLAYGNRDYSPTGETLPGPPREQNPLAAVVSGEERWQPRPAQGDPAPWKQILLWSVLILAVAVLSLMAYLMARSMRKKG